MNWFLLLLILKCLHATWAAPIDFEDITTEGLSEATTTNNFFELVENTTANVSQTLNLTSKVRQEENRSETTTEQSAEVNTETEFLNFGTQIPHTTENVAKVSYFSSENVSQELLETFQTTEPNERIKTESEEVPSTTTAPETEESTPILNTETVLSKASSLEENTSQNLQNTLDNVSEIVTEAVTEPARQSSIHEIVIANTQSNVENLYQNLENQSEKLVENPTNKQAEQSFTDTSKTLTQSSGTISDGTDTIEFGTTSSNVEQSNADSSANPTQSTSDNDFSTNATPEQSIYRSTDNDSTIVFNSSIKPNETQFIGDRPITEAASQRPEQSDLREIEVASNQNEGSYFKQSIDSFAEQLQDITSGVSRTATDLVNKVEDTLSPEVAQNSPNYPHISNDSSMEAKQSTEQPEQLPKHSPTFKETVDSFIADVLDIGSNLNLRNKMEKEEQVLETNEYTTAKKQEQPEQYEVNEGLSTGSSFAGTEKPESILNSSSTAENKTEIKQNLENLVGSASEFSSNFGKTVESLWSVNGKEQETIAEQKAVTDERLVGEVAQDASLTIQTLVEDTRNEKDVNLELLNTEPGNSKDASPAPISPENSQSQDLNEEVEHSTLSEDIISPTQSPVEVESVTNSLENSHQEENVSESQELVPTTVSPLEVESVTHNSEFVSASEVANISLNQEIEIITSYPELVSSNQDSQNTVSNSDLESLKTVTHSAHYEVIEPVAAVSSTTEEERNANSNLTEQTESSKSEGHDQQNLKPSEQIENLSQIHHDSTFTDTQAPDSQKQILESDPFFRTSSSESIASHYNGIQGFNVRPITPQEIGSSSEPITAASTTAESTTSASNILETTTNAFNKFENTLKTLLVEEKLIKDGKPATNSDNSEPEMSTTNPAKQEKLSLATSSSPTAADETTILPKKFEEELQMAVKALEQTTHQQFEEFQNNLKETFKKFTVFGGMEHEKSTESTTTFKSEIATQVPQSEEENTFSTSNEKENATVQETNAKSLDIAIEEPRSGAIHQAFVDTFEENPSTSEVPKERDYNFEISTSFAELPTVKHEALTLASSIESETKGVTTTESSIVLTTLTPSVENEGQQNQKTEDVTTPQPEKTTFLADVKEDLPAADGEHNTTEVEDTTTEVTIANTIPPYIEAESLQEHVNHESHNQLGEYNSDVVTSEAQDLRTEQEQQQQHEHEQRTTEEATEQGSVEENHRELTQTDQPIVVDDDISTTAAPETTTEQEMVKFVEHSDGIHNGTTEATAKQYKNEELGSTLATLQTQMPLTQPSFMEEQQQQIESTTTHTSQTHTASDVTTNDTVAQTTVADTTEETIYSTTTVNEEVQEVETTTTTPQELLEDTTILPIESVEAEARSLSLPPPKLEYLQSVDGVEVFYGYSIVKHN